MSTKRTALGCLAAAMMITSGSGCTRGDSSGFAGDARAEAPSALGPAASPAGLEELIRDNTAFGIDLYRRLSAGEATNVFLSPVSISSALAMTYEGARGRTREQMASALRLTLPAGDVGPAFLTLADLLASRNVAPEETFAGGKKGLSLDLVNMVWVQAGLPIQPDYTHTIETYYRGGLATRDFARDPEGARRSINAFLEQKTNARIKELLPPGAVDSLSRLVLTNTVYFHGSWENAFDPKYTKPDVFHAPAGDVSVLMMHAGQLLGYAEGDGWQMTELPYYGHIGSKLGMIILLPQAGRFEQIRDALTPSWLSGAVDRMRAHRGGMVELSIPRFAFTYGTVSLKASLTSMGMVDAFDPERADFSGMVREPRLRIDAVYHKTFLAVDEYGTVAAAATGVTVQDLAGPEPPVVHEMNVDRPFIVLIRDASGAVLFMGQVMVPREER